MMSFHTNYPETAQELASQLRDALVDHASFEARLKPCTLERCSATCCYDGVYLSAEEAKGVSSLADKHRERLLDYGLELPEVVVVSARNGRARKTATRPAAAGEFASDFPSHFNKTRCVFLDHSGRCGLQRLAIDDQLGDWFLKPLTCWIHPIVILPPNRDRPRAVITLVSAEKDPQKSEDYPGFASCTHCGRAEDASGDLAWKVLRNELESLSALAGRDFYGELSAPSIDY